MANIEVEVVTADGGAAEMTPHVPLPLKVLVKNNGADAVNLLGVNFVCSDSRLHLATFGVVPSGAVSQGSNQLDNQCWVINAGQTGSYRGDVVSNDLMGLKDSTFNFEVNAMVQPNEAQGALVSGSNSGSFVTASSPLTISYGNAIQFTTPDPDDFSGRAENFSPVVVWSLFDNKRNISQDFDLAATSIITQDQGDQYNNFWLPPELNAVGSEWVSSDPSVADVVPTGSYEADWTTSGSVGNPFIVGGGGAITIKGVGTCQVYNNFAPDISGSVTIKVVEALPVALRIIPSVGQTNPNSVVALPTFQFKSQVKYTDSDWTDVSSGASTTWSSSDTKVFTISSAGLITQVAGAIAGDQATITCVYNNTSTGRPARLVATAVAVVGKSN